MLFIINSSLIIKSKCDSHFGKELRQGKLEFIITFPETNPMARNLFSCGQSKQACSVYHTNYYQMRMDKSSMVLHYGQMPLLKSRYGKYINKFTTNIVTDIDSITYGVNVICV
jgi:DNA-directed RNA polymerase beta subunit